MMAMRTVYVERHLPKILAVRALKSRFPGVVFSALSPARMHVFPDPALPGRRGVRVRNRRCGVCATDVSLLYADADVKASLVALPGHARMYLGHEVVGEVVEVGPDVTRVKVGDRVVLDTCFKANSCVSQELVSHCRHCAEGNLFLCENQCLGRGVPGRGAGFGDGYTCHETEVVKVPDDIDDDQAMLAEPFTVGVRAVKRRLPAAHERALVLGAGMIGLATAQAVKALSPHSHLSVVARYGHQADAARTLGADEVIRDDVYLATQRITGAKLYTGMLDNRMLLGGFDVVFDCVGSGESLTDALRFTRASGAVVLVGANIGAVTADLTPVWSQEVSLLGSMAHGMEQHEGRTLSTYALVFELYRAGKLKIDGLITDRYPLSRWQDAVRRSMDKRAGVIKVALECT